MLHASFTFLILFLQSPFVVQTQVHGSLEATLTRAAGEHGPALAAQAARLLRWQGDIIKNIHPKDKIRLLYDTETGEPELVALKYYGSQIHLVAYRFVGQDGVARYYDENGSLVEPWLKNLPVPEYVQITEILQRGRGKRKHDGLDFKADEGSNIVSPFDGKITRVNWNTRRNGRCIEVQYKNGNYARFLHLSNISTGISPGTQVLAGHVLGQVGSTGRSFAPHLHYDVRAKNGRLLDPIKVHGTAPFSIKPGRVPEFAAARRMYDDLMDKQLSVAAGESQ